MSDATDREIDRWDDDVARLLAGRAARGADPTEQWLAAAARPSAPAAVLARVERSMARARRRADRPSRAVALAALGLAASFVFQGVGNLVAGQWIADHLGEPYGPHAFWEGGVAMIALGLCAAAGAVSRRWSTASVLTCTPLATAFGLHGLTEVGVFAAGVALHLTEGTLGILLALLWWREHRRDSGRAPHEGEP